MIERPPAASTCSNDARSAALSEDLYPLVAASSPAAARSDHQASTSESVGRVPTSPFAIGFNSHLMEGAPARAQIHPGALLTITEQIASICPLESACGATHFPSIVRSSRRRSPPALGGGPNQPWSDVVRIRTSAKVAAHPHRDPPREVASLPFDPCVESAAMNRSLPAPANRRSPQSPTRQRGKAHVHPACEMTRPVSVRAHTSSAPESSNTSTRPTPSLARASGSDVAVYDRPLRRPLYVMASRC